uniref:Kinetochore protein Nuf2 N-terminal domain-containing protein n=1 Tax=Glossina palpalis gambiensis TaxID=67801 RepID=A0A1B0ANQ0_9MUSC
MFKKENMDSWNAVFTECQLRSSDLSNPTEGFLTGVLVVYLKRFGYKIEPPSTMENNEYRLFRIKLVKQIDHMLKISNESYVFTYYDLIRPTPKKTSQMLCILLNYLFYYNMYKEEVFKMVGKPLNELQDLKARVEKTRCENERRQKDKNAELKQSIQMLNEGLSTSREELKTYVKKIGAKKGDIGKLEREIEELTEKRKQLQEDKNRLLNKVVSNDEFQELGKQIPQLENKLATLTKEQGHMESVLSKRNEDIKKLQEQSAELDELSRVFPKDLLTQLENSNKQLKNLQREAPFAESKNKLSDKDTKELKEAVEQLQAEYSAKKNELGNKRLEEEKKIADQQHVIKENEKTIKELEQREINLKCRIAEQRDIEKIIDDGIREIMIDSDE